MRDKQLYLFGFHKDSDSTPRRHTLILPLDILILSGVVIILLFTFFFSLGVERGKNIVYRSLQDEKEQIQDDGTDKVKASSPEQADKPAVVEVAPTQPDAPEPVEEELKEHPEAYRIQVASFQKEGSAEREAETLRQKGYPVVVARKGKYVVVYVGGFDTEKEAKDNLQSLRKRYKDCLLRRL
jgi:hypothetical protein